MATYTAKKIASFKPNPRASIPKAPKVLGVKRQVAKFQPKKIVPTAPAKSTYQPLSGFRPPAAPSASPSPASPQAQPFDDAYEDQVGLANRQYGQTVEGINYQQGQVKRQYGFDDPSDPFNAMAMLTRAYQQGQRRTLNTAGNVYSSAHLRNTDANRFQYMQSEGDLRSKYQEALHALEQQRAQAGIDRDTTIGNAKLDALGRAPRADDPGPAAQAGPAKPDPTKYYNHPVVVQTQQLAQRLWNSGKRSGPKWGDIKSILGYDPRASGGLSFRR